MYAKLLMAALASLFFTFPLFAATWYASPTGSADAACTVDDPGTIQAAVNKAANAASWDAGDEVVLLSGTYDYSESTGSALSGLSGNSCVTVAKKYLTIRSESGNPSSVILLGRGGETYISEDLLTTNAPQSVRAIGANVPMRLEDITVTNFYMTTDGTALASKTANQLVVDNCIVACNLGRKGAATLNVSGVDTLFLCNTNATDVGGAMKGGSAANCVFRGNFGVHGGAVASAGSIVNCQFEGNEASSYGGAVHNSYPIQGCFFTNNIAQGEGGAVYGAQYPGTAKHLCTNCVFIGNLAKSRGGALRYASATHCTFIENAVTNGYGGAIDTWTVGVVYSISHCTFLRNSASANGGAVMGSNAGETATNCVFVGNRAGGGGACHFVRKIFDCHFTNNIATGAGGAILGTQYPQVVFYGDHCDFVGNRSGSDGGAIRYFEVDNSIFISNTCTGGNGGGAIGNFGYSRKNRGSYAATNCVFVGNTSPAGGAIRKCTAPVRGCVFVGNRSTGAGGAIYETSATECVFTNNHAVGEGGAFIAGGRYQSSYNTASNCVFVGNSSDSNGGAIKYGHAYNTLFASNSCPSSKIGGAIMNQYQNLTCIISNCVFEGNSGGTGGAAYEGTYKDCLFTDNAGVTGGAGGLGTYRNCSFVGNTAANGGALASSYAISCIFTNNSATGSGGATYTGSNTARYATNCVFQANSATNYGASATLSLFDCLFDGNKSLGSKNALVSGSAYNCTFVNNEMDGGSVTASATVNCLFADNTPYDIGGGKQSHALYATSTGKPTFTDCIQTDEPRFNLGKDPKAPWYAPQRGSPARDAGLTRGYAETDLDLAGRLRLNGPVDIGCYENWPFSGGTRFLLR